jgi:hypothetical protein
MRITYYREYGQESDYIAVGPRNTEVKNLGICYHAIVSIPGSGPASVYQSFASRSYLDRCDKIPRSDVPADWVKAFDALWP